MAGLGLTNTGYDPADYQTWVRTDAETTAGEWPPAGVNLPNLKTVMDTFRANRQVLYIAAAALFLLALLRSRR